MKKAGQVMRATVAITALLGGLALAAPAYAETPPQVLAVPPIVIVNPRDPSTATIIGVYRCYGGQPIHLWVSAKQGGPDPSAEGAGGTPAAAGGAVAWYDTNIIEADPVVCDGRPHVARVTVGQHPNKAQLTSGSAWIQFCLVAPDPNGEEEFGIVASQQMFGRVIRAF